MFIFALTNASMLAPRGLTIWKSSSKMKEPRCKMIVFSVLIYDIQYINIQQDKYTDPG